MLMILARLVRSESFWAVAKVRSPHTGPGIRYIIESQARERGDEWRFDQPPMGGYRGDVTPQRAGSGKGMGSRGPCLQQQC